jgi:predicted RNase H-like HicB family nuclease
VTDFIVRRFAVMVEGDDTTNYSAYAPDLPGCVATGATVEEAERAMRVAIDFHLEGLQARG